MYPRIHIQKNETVKQIAFFDFDGTVTTKDSLLEFIKHQNGSVRFYLGFLLNAPFLVAYKTGIIPNQLAKEKILAFFFRKTAIDKFQQRCDDFADTILPSLIRPKALNEIRKLQSAGVEVVIISASAENWIQKWCDRHQLSLLATRLEQKQAMITGKIAGLNCYGEEKVRRIRESYNLNEYTVIYGYGDTKGDRPFLQLATFCFYKPFR